MASRPRVSQPGLLCSFVLPAAVGSIPTEKRWKEWRRTTFWPFPLGVIILLAPPNKGVRGPGEHGSSPSAPREPGGGAEFLEVGLSSWKAFSFHSLLSKVLTSSESPQPTSPAQKRKAVNLPATRARTYVWDWAPPKRTPRRGFKCKKLTWEVMPRSTCMEWEREGTQERTC